MNRKKTVLSTGHERLQNYTQFNTGNQTNNRTQHATAQHSTAQHSTAQHSTAPHNLQAQTAAASPALRSATVKALHLCVLPALMMTTSGLIALYWWRAGPGFVLLYNGTQSVWLQFTLRIWVTAREILNTGLYYCLALPSLSPSLSLSPITLPRSTAHRNNRGRGRERNREKGRGHDWERRWRERSS